MSESFVNPVITDAIKVRDKSINCDSFGIQMGKGAVMPTTQANFVLYASSIGIMFPELM
jgi:hypothetical protein